MTFPVRVAFTGVGAVSPLGEGALALAEGALAGRSGIRRPPHFAGTPFEERVAGAIERAPGLERRGDAALAFARRAALEALADARIAASTEKRVALVVGSTMAPRDRAIDAIAAALAASVGLASRLVVVVETACTSGSAAVALGALLLRFGQADVAIAGGMDELDLKSFAGFAALGLLAPSACTPFGPLVGTTLGEGAAFFVLEREPDASARGATVHAILEGDGSSADAFHATSPHPSGDGLRSAIEGALADAGIGPEAVDWVSAHGTGRARTTRPRPPRSRGVRRACGRDRSRRPRAEPVMPSARRGAELAVALGGMRAEQVPPTLGADAPDPGVRSRSPRRRGRRAPGACSSWGGIRRREQRARPRAPGARGRAARVTRRPVYIAAMGGFGGADADVDPMGRLDDFDRPAPPRGRRAPRAGRESARPGRHVARAHRRGRARGGRRARARLADPLDRIRLFVGQRCVPEVAEFRDALAARSFEPRAGRCSRGRVLNTATGAASRARGASAGRRSRSRRGGKRARGARARGGAPRVEGRRGRDRGRCGRRGRRRGGRVGRPLHVVPGTWSSRAPHLDAPGRRDAWDAAAPDARGEARGPHGIVDVPTDVNALSTAGLLVLGRAVAVGRAVLVRERGALARVQIEIAPRARA
ncbi:MAG: beta-ketoacyl synthase N-terminal-like domain-containing protein [Polyangiaceae bacterium]